MVLRKIKYHLCLLSILYISCRHEPQLAGISESNYPENVAVIMLGKCATQGCHNNLSYTGAGGINLTTWDNLFKGGNGGSSVIPYRPDFSTLCYYTNTDSTLGVMLTPSMPYNSAPLSKEEYITLRDWVALGAPSLKGEIKFADRPNRKKVYVANMLCDEVTVFDAETFLQMRYIHVGNKQVQEFPYCVKVSPDKKHWYVSFFSQSNIIQKFRADDDRLVGDINLGSGSWNYFAITADSKYGYFLDNSGAGKVAYTDLEKGVVLATYTFGGNFKYPAGIVIDEQAKKIYLGSLTGNFIYKIDITDPISPVISELPIDGTSQVQYNSTIDPIQLVNDPVRHLCYIACQKSNEVRVVNMLNDSLSGVIPLGSSPSQMSYSIATKRLFVSCPADDVSFPGNKGSIAVINSGIYSVYKKINSGYQPFGLAVDDEQKILAVANANLSSQGNAPHHVSGCGGRNGNVSFIDLNTLNLIPGKRSEVAVYPISVDTR